MFAACRDAVMDWIITGAPCWSRPSICRWPPPSPGPASKSRSPLANETVTITGYGQCRQITLFEHAQPVLQILISDFGSCAGALMVFLRARWRIENLFTYLDFYGIDALVDYRHHQGQHPPDRQPGPAPD